LRADKGGQVAETAEQGEQGTGQAGAYQPALGLPLQGTDGDCSDQPGQGADEPAQEDPPDLNDGRVPGGGGHAEAVHDVGGYEDGDSDGKDRSPPTAGGQGGCGDEEDAGEEEPGDDARTGDPHDSPGHGDRRAAVAQVDQPRGDDHLAAAAGSDRLGRRALPAGA